MRKIVLSLFIFCCARFSIAQKSKISFDLHFGPQANFFVRSYDESPNSIYKKSFYKKNLIGTIGGAEIKFSVGKKGALVAGYASSSNTSTIGYATTINGVFLGISDFNITHKNKFFQLGYELAVQKSKSKLFAEGGVFYLRSNQQEISISESRREILVEERNFNKNKLEEGGIYLGLSYMINIDTKVRFGFKSRLYYLVSTSTFESLTFTPTLSYRF